MKLSLEQFKEVFPGAILELHRHIEHLMPRYEITEKLQEAHFLAQYGFETSGFKTLVENLRLSSKQLTDMFPNLFVIDLPHKYAYQPEKIANRIYANRMGNGSEQSGDGWKFRGRGLCMLTGKDNYLKASHDFKMDFIARPDLVSKHQNAVHVGCWFWKINNFNDIIDTFDNPTALTAITKVINGGVHGIEERRRLFDKIIAIIN